MPVKETAKVICASSKMKSRVTGCALPLDKTLGMFGDMWVRLDFSGLGQADKVKGQIKYNCLFFRP